MAKNALIIILILLFSSCNNNDNNSVETPWGTIVGGDNASDYDINDHDSIDHYDDIIKQGELILATVSSPETFYEYRGASLGTQYMLCLEFAKHIGVSLRVDVFQDKKQLFDILTHGNADIVIIDDTPKSDSSDGNNCLQHLRNENDVVKLKANNWFVCKNNKILADSINNWYSPEKLLLAKSKNSSFVAQSQTIQRHVYSPIFSKSKGIISSYDHLFRKYAPTAMVDWRLLAAQCYQESCFDPNARSWAGACGLMQIMPSTALTLSLPKERIFTPEDNVAAAARLMRNLDNSLSDVRDPNERLKLRLAAYNCGLGHVRDAMALTAKNNRNPHRWSDVSQFMMRLQYRDGYNDPVVKHGYMRATETVDYVNRICQRYLQYCGVSSLGEHSAPTFSGGGRTPTRATKNHKYK